jgi:hypothetical protein
MGEAFVLDTSAVIKYLNESFPEKGYDFVDKEFTNGNTLLSVISRIELLA